MKTFKENLKMFIFLNKKPRNKIKKSSFEYQINSL